MCMVPSFNHGSWLQHKERCWHARSFSIVVDFWVHYELAAPMHLVRQAQMVLQWTAACNNMSQATDESDCTSSIFASMTF